MADPARTRPALDLDPYPNHTLPADFDDRLALLLDDLAVLAVECEPGSHWRVHFDTTGDRDAAASLLAVALGEHVAVSSADVSDDGWAGKVQQTLSAVRVGEVIVAPPWDVPATPDAEGSSVIVIDPSTGFGTGHHQSTRLCLRLLQGENLTGRHVLDVGTGSGVLAIVAAVRGAAGVVAIDSDPDAVQSARANAARNGVSEAIDLRVADVGAASLPPADLVLANLTMAALRRHGDELRRLVQPRGALIVSGFTHDQVSLVTEAFPVFDTAAREDEDDWVALRLSPRPAVPGTAGPG